MLEKYFNLEPDLKKMLFLSLAFHAGVVFIFTIKMTFFTDVPKYEPAIRVDLVGLPDKRTPDKPLAPAAPKPEPVKEVAKPQEQKPKVEEKKVESKTSTVSQSDALNKLKAQSAIEKLKNTKTEKPVQNSGESKPQTDVIKGNAIQPGTSLRGLSKIEFDHYIGSLDAHVKNNWALPEWMMSQGLNAEVYIKIDKNGHVIERKITKKSGNAEFDNYALSAIEKSNPFPPPPEKFTDLVGIQGITFAFP